MDALSFNASYFNSTVVQLEERHRPHFHFILFYFNSTVVQLEGSRSMLRNTNKVISILL